MEIREYSTEAGNAGDLPEDLWRVKPALSRLFVQAGDSSAFSLLDRLPGDGLAVVGTRAAQARSLELTRSVIRELKGFHLIIVSGLAFGIDAAAHQSALDARLPTIALLAGGLDLTYPAEHQLLRSRILDSGGLVISEHPFGTLPRPNFFLDRNRLIAAITKATWVVEAPISSGALNTAKHARLYDRTVFSTPCFPGDPRMAGNQDLLSENHAVALWRALDLDSVWGDLASFLSIQSNREKRRRISEELSGIQSELAFEALELIEQIRKWGAERGGAHVEALLEWATTKNWSPETFFHRLQEVLRSGAILDQQGVLVARRD